MNPVGASLLAMNPATNHKPQTTNHRLQASFYKNKNM
jgi:hypothetical protein